MTTAGGHAFNPAGFQYIKSLAEKAGQFKEAPQQRLVSRGLQALDDYQGQLLQARKEAEELVSLTVKQFPDSAAELQQQFDSYQFRKLRRHVARLQASLTIDQIRGLTEQLEKGNEPDRDNGISLEEQCLRWEREVTEAEVPMTSDLCATPTKLSADTAELRSSRQLRESMLKRRVDKMIAQAIASMPDDPGPLNPQMLAIRSLTTLGDLSPAYLSRFVPYIETLHCLEQVDDRS
ncbi:MAG: DUF2894 domain-containing protein [Halioglobus sp.]